jgi:hypothetical protein
MSARTEASLEPLQPIADALFAEHPDLAALCVSWEAERRGDRWMQGWGIWPSDGRNGRTDPEAPPPHLSHLALVERSARVCCLASDAARGPSCPASGSRSGDGMRGRWPGRLVAPQATPLVGRSAPRRAAAAAPSGGSSAPSSCRRGGAFPAGRGKRACAPGGCLSSACSARASAALCAGVSAARRPGRFRNGKTHSGHDRRGVASMRRPLPVSPAGRLRVRTVWDAGKEG